ncbi:MAG: B12-binding domain-containing radical SAM protein [Thermoplasmatales archaeon]|nr:MAG: B12-binding domain-containing radical SAM protein [Thermoplasmatales archaeon]
MNILIIENTWMGGSKYGFFEKTLLTAFSILPTLYARKLAAITPKKHSVNVLTERYSKINFDEPYDIVNINFTTSTTPRAYEIADKFREKGTTVVLSGPHPSVLPEEAKQHGDSVLLGWGELNWLQLLKDFENNELKPFYQPIKYDKSVHIPPTNIQLPGFVITGAIEATRGCPYKCDFCPETNLPGGSQFYARPVDDVIAEIKSMPQKTLMFYDTSLTIKPDYSKSLFKEMKGLHKKFFCNGNVDELARDVELVKLSKEAGCVSWLIGFESISQETIDKVGKKTNKVMEYFQAVKNVHDNGMAVVGCFMFGFDNDKKNVFDETLKAIKELEIDVADFCVLTPFPGTPLFNRLDKEGRILTKDWTKYTMKNVVFEPKNMTAEELLNGVKKMYYEFYSNPYTVKRIVRSLRLGLYPFFMALARNAVANMNRRAFYTSK